MTVVLGLNTVLANLARIGAQIVEAGGAGVERAGDEIASAWVDNIESEGLVDTGHYRDSIEVSVEGSEATVYTQTEYARFLEFGTSHIPAHPVAERAFDERQDQAIDSVADAIRRVTR